MIGALYVSTELIPAGAARPAVHLGHHHGADGALFVISALTLTRALPSIPGARLRGLLTFTLALMTVYGLGILANDAWGEQVVKRGWTSVKIPSVLFPAATPA